MLQPALTHVGGANETPLTRKLSRRHVRFTLRVLAWSLAWCKNETMLAGQKYYPPYINQMIILTYVWLDLAQVIWFIDALQKNLHCPSQDQDVL